MSNCCGSAVLFPPLVFPRETLFCFMMFAVGCVTSYKCNSVVCFIYQLVKNISLSRASETCAICSGKSFTMSGVTVGKLLLLALELRGSGQSFKLLLEKCLTLRKEHIWRLMWLPLQSSLFAFSAQMCSFCLLTQVLLPTTHLAGRVETASPCVTRLLKGAYGKTLM